MSGGLLDEGTDQDHKQEGRRSEEKRMGTSKLSNREAPSGYFTLNQL